MTTAEAIESMTDTGQFEILATRVLRITDDDCRFLEHMGVNAAGKTVPNPIDGFCRVPGVDPPRFVMVAFNTEKLASLERKWLFDHRDSENKKLTSADDGDLVKAARLADLLRKNHSGAQFVVHLCTNKQPDDDLMLKVGSVGKTLGLDVRFLARSRLRDVLDVYPDGQWLRKEHLGIQAERLSFQLLRELSAKSLGQYGREFLITPPESFVATSSERALASSLESSRSVHVVTGPSGGGKSVICYQALRAHLTQGGIGLWIPGELAAVAGSLDHAIDLTLRSLYPTIEPGSGSIALRIRSPSHRLLVIVDDINRGGSPAESLRKLLAWGRPTLDEKEKDSEPRFVLLLPAWDLFWAPLDGQFKSSSWLARIPISVMDEAEALACLAASLGSGTQQLSVTDQEQVVAALGYDPILIALFAAQEPPEPHAQLLAHEVIHRFVIGAEAEAATSSNHLQVEYDRALTTLATRLLSERDLYPRWEDVLEWLSTIEVEAIRELARLGKICRVTSQGSENRFSFRHDRILEHFLVRALQSMLASPESHSSILKDPFYASLVGRVLALGQPSDALIAWVQKHSPLALVTALRYIPFQADDVGERVAVAITAWLKSATSDRNTPSVLLFEAYRLLEETDSPRLLKVTQPFLRHPMLARARLANGDAVGGAISFSDDCWFAPAVNDRGMDAVMSRALHRYRQKLIEACSAMLMIPELKVAERRGALVLAGFIGDAALSVPVRAAWDYAPNRLNVLLPGLWAGLRCASADPASDLDEMMTVWAGLPDHGEIAGLSERSRMAQELQSAIRRGVSEAVLCYLISKARSDEALRWPITITLEQLDHPLAVTFLVEEAARIEKRIRDTGKFSPWLMTFHDQWDPTSNARGRRLPPDSIQAIRSSFESDKSDPQLRETGFGFWVRAVDDLGLLRSISDDHPQFRSVLWRRAALGDLSSASLIKGLLVNDDSWFRVIHNIWSEQFRDVVEDALLKLVGNTPSDHSGGRTNLHYHLSHLLRDIPPEEAERLISSHWGQLRFSPLFVQLALYIGSPRCIALAARAINDYPDTTAPFEHLSIFFGFSTTGLMDRLEMRHVEVLLPYLERLDDHTLSDMAAYSERGGRREWALVYLKPEFDRRRALLPKSSRQQQEYIERLGRHYFPSDADLLEELDWIEHQGGPSLGIYQWGEEYGRRRDTHARWKHVLNEWLSARPTLERFRLFAQAILEHGSRSDIDLLYRRAISGDEIEIDRIRDNARFGLMRRSLV